jgi:hypothetical protein
MEHSIDFIVETVMPVANSDLLILENKQTSSGISKVSFLSRLQTLNEVNGNRRIYGNDVGNSILEKLGPKAMRRGLLQEIDHPIVNIKTPDGKIDDGARRRAITVEINNTGSIIRKMDKKKNDIVGEMETLTSFKGPDLYRLIVDDKADIGFSVRMFGKSVVNESTKVATIVNPIHPVTYDVVSEPSHSTAKIMNFLSDNLHTTCHSSELGYINESNDQLSAMLINENINVEDINKHLDEVLEAMIQHTFRELGKITLDI